MSTPSWILRAIAMAGVAATVFLAPAPALAGELRFDGRVAHGTYVFKVKGVAASSVRSARLVARGKTRRLTLSKVRAGIRRGTVRVSARSGTRSSLAAGGQRPRLKLTTSNVTATASRKPPTAPPPPAPPPALPAAPPAAPGGLAWAAPALSNPTTLTLNTASNYFKLDNQKDYIVKYPSSVKIGQLMIEGGRNITIVGGEQQNYAGVGTAVVFFTDEGTNGAPVPGRVIHAEGLKIDMAGGDVRDVFGLMTPSAIVQLENIRAMNVHGVGSGVHPDIVQNYSDILGLRVDRLTGSTNYQGFFIRPQEGLIKSVDLRHVNLTLNANGQDTYCQVLFFANYDGAAPDLHLDSFYIQNNRPGQNAQDAVYPDATATGMQSIYDGVKATFPTFLRVTGAVYNGNPPGGDYVPATGAGLGYTTPG
jgi:hypothetical protein